MKAASSRSPPIPKTCVPLPPNRFDILPNDPGDEDEETAVSEAESGRSRGTNSLPHSSKPRKRGKVPRMEKAQWHGLPAGSAERLLAKMEARPEEAVWALRHWTHYKRQDKITEGVVCTLVTTYVPDALDTLEALREPPMFVRAINRSSMMVLVTLETLHNLRGFTVEALLDCGAMNGFMKRDHARRATTTNGQGTFGSVPIHYHGHQEEQSHYRVQLATTA